MKTIKIFLASSEELKEERLQLADLVENLNHTLAKQDMHIQLVKWEYLDSSMGPKHKQEEYNEELRTCELCLVLYWTRFGMYTKTELDTAYNQLCAGNNPKKLYVYFKDGSEISPDLQSFRDSFPDQYGHFFCRFENIDTLKADFLLQFMDYQSKTLIDSKLIEVKDGKVVVDGKEYVDLQNVPFAGNNGEYNTIKKSISDKQNLLQFVPTDNPLYSQTAEELRQLKEKLAKMESSLWDTALMITRLSTTKCSERLLRAMDLFNQGDNKGAQAILNEEEIEKDVQHNLNLIKLGEEGKKGLKTNIDEYLLKIRTYENEMEEGWLQKRYELFDRVLYMTISLYGENAEETSDAYQRLGTAYFDIGDYSQALKYHQKALRIREKVLGVEHPETSVLYNNLSLIYLDLNDYSSALKYQYKALNIKKQTLGWKHPSTIGSYFNVGNIFSQIGDNTSALKYHQYALETREILLGIDHPETADSYNSLGIIYSQLGNYTRALEYHQKALETREKVFGIKHPKIGTSYTNIGILYSRQGDYSAALDYLKKALLIEEKMYGVKHPKTANLYYNIGLIYANLGNYQLASTNFLKVLVTEEIYLGVKHPKTANTFKSLAYSYYLMGEYDKALPWAEKAVAAFPENPNYIDTLATVYQGLGRFNKALEQFEHCLKLCKEQENSEGIQETEEKIATLKELMKKEG